MSLPNRTEARALLEEYVSDDYQRFHALMVGTAMEGYAKKLGEDTELWFLTGYLHDLDYDRHPSEHPGPSLEWFNSWNYSPELIQAVLAHANGFNGFNTPAKSQLDKALIACDEICGIFYAYQKLNPIPFGEMKVKSIKKRLAESRFAPGIDRSHIYNGVEDFGITIDEHIANLIEFLKDLKSPELASQS
jgi:predicted hydrolase (HD superfamily)